MQVGSAVATVTIQRPDGLLHASALSASSKSLLVTTSGLQSTGIHPSLSSEKLLRRKKAKCLSATIRSATVARLKETGECNPPSDAVEVPELTVEAESWQRKELSCQEGVAEELDISNGAHAECQGRGWRCETTSPPTEPKTHASVNSPEDLEGAANDCPTPPNLPHAGTNPLSSVDAFDQIQSWLDTWRAPLQTSYDPPAVAEYFSRQPLLVAMRVLQITVVLTGALGVKALVNLASGKAGDGSGDDETARGKTFGGLHPMADRLLKESLLNLGPTFVKVAQSLSSRPDLVGADTAKVLSELQDRMPPFPTAAALRVIEEEFGRPAADVFPELSEEPVAAASLGQVYKGRLADGSVIAVKVQRPNVLERVAMDVFILRLGLGVVRRLARINSDLRVLADEVGRGLFGEMDYCQEARNSASFAAAHSSLPFIQVPQTIPLLTTRRVLTMTWVEGESPNTLIAAVEDDRASVSAAARARAKLLAMVSMGVECSLVQLLETGVMHADPHPGNLLLSREGKLVYLDFGLLTRVEDRHMAAMLRAIVHLVNEDWRQLADDFSGMDLLKPGTDKAELAQALEDAFLHGPVPSNRRDSLVNSSFGQIVGALWRIALRFRFRLPAYYTLVLRSLASLEGIALTANPSFKIFSAAYPYVLRRLVTDNSQSGRDTLRQLLLDTENRLQCTRALDLLEQMQGGRNASAPAPPGESERTFQLHQSETLTQTLQDLALSPRSSHLRRLILKSDLAELAELLTSAQASTLRDQIAAAVARGIWTLWHPSKSAKSQVDLGGGREEGGMDPKTETCSTIRGWGEGWLVSPEDDDDATSGGERFGKGGGEAVGADYHSGGSRRSAVSRDEEVASGSGSGRAGRLGEWSNDRRTEGERERMWWEAYDGMIPNMAKQRTYHQPRHLKKALLINWKFRLLVRLLLRKLFATTLYMRAKIVWSLTTVVVKVLAVLTMRTLKLCAKRVLRLARCNSFFDF